MSSFLKQDVRKFIGAPLGLLAIIYILFSLAERQVTSDSYEVFVLRMLTDHYLLIYCMTPIFLLSFFRNLQEDTSFLIIRFRKFSRYFYVKWLAILIFAILFVLLQMIIVLIMGTGLPLENVFPTASTAENELMSYFSTFFSSPVVAIFSVSLYMMAGLAFVGMSILTIFHFFNRRVVTVFILFAYGIMALSIKITGLGNLPFLTINRYIILHHNFEVENGILWTITGMIVLFIIQVVLIQFAWYKKISIFWNVKIKGLFFYYARALWTRKNILLLLVILVMLTIWKSTAGIEESVQDYVIRFFYGSEIGSFHLITFLEQIIYYGTPLYLFAIFIERWCTDDNMHVYIRTRKKKTWLSSIISNGLIFHIIYFSLSFVLLFIMGVLTDKSWFTHTIQISENLQYDVWLIFICLKILEFSVLFLIFILLFILLKNVTVAYLIVMSMHGFSLIPVIFSSYNPAGLVTVARLQVLDGSIGITLTQALVILIVEFILLLVLVSLSYKRYFN